MLIVRTEPGVPSFSALSATLFPPKSQARRQSGPAVPIDILVPHDL